MASQVPITIRAQPAVVSAAAVRGKKRPGSPAVSVAPPAAGSSSGSKKKKGQQQPQQQPQQLLLQAATPATQPQVIKPATCLSMVLIVIPCKALISASYSACFLFFLIEMDGTWGCFQTSTALVYFQRENLTSSIHVRSVDV